MTQEERAAVIHEILDGLRRLGLVSTKESEHNHEAE